MATIKIAGATLNQTPLDWENNLGNIKEAIEVAIADDVEILCLPELCITGYGCEDVFLGDWVYTKAKECLETIRPRCKNITVIIGLPFQHNGKNYNVAAIVQNQQYRGIYAKHNMARDGVHYEPRWFIPWKEDTIETTVLGNQICEIGDVTFEYKGIKIGFEICEDAWTVNRPAKRLVKKNIDMILNPSASHFAMQKTFEREDLVKESSEKFNCTYVYVNLLGNEAGRMIYDGEILVARKGKIILRNELLSYHNFNLKSISIDFANEKITEAEPYTDDKNNEFVKAASLALFDYLRKSRSKGFVLSLSGGADSSTSAVLVAEMVRRGVEQLGITTFVKKIGLIEELKNVPIDSEKQAVKFIVNNLLHCAYQGTKNSSEETLASARELANEIGAQFSHWKIDEEVTSYTKKIESVLNRDLTWDKDDIALQNIQARARSPIIWMLANIKNALLITTSNRSEGDVGYTTMDGDTSGSIAPIAAVDKYFIINWLKWAEKELGYRSLQHVNNLTPTAELRPTESTQTDEDDLMPFKILVAIERLAIRDHRSPLEVFKVLKHEKLTSEEKLKGYIAKFFRLWAKNQWKRERIAPAFHLDDFNVDPRTWCRFPILSSGFKEELDALQNTDD